MQYYGNSTKPGANVPFNLRLVRNVDKNNIIESIDKIVKDWLDNMPENQVANWAVSTLKYKTIKKILNEMFKINYDKSTDTNNNLIVLNTIQYYFNTLIYTFINIFQLFKDI